MIEPTIIFFIILLILLFYSIFFSNSIFEVSLKKGNYPGFFFLLSFIIFIMPSSLLLNILPVENFWVAFKVDPEIIFPVTLYVLFTFFLLIFFIFIVVKNFPRYFRYNYPIISTADSFLYRRFVIFSLSFSLLLVGCSWSFFNVNHGFVTSIIHDQSVSAGRFELAENKITLFIKYFFHILASLLTVVIASPVFKERNWARFFLISVVFFIVSWGGHKAELINIFLIYFVTIATFSKFKLNLFNFIAALGFLLGLFFFVYQVVLIQYPHLAEIEDFLDYFYQRVFIAQMIGVYEQFSLHIQDSMYILHAIPFANFFIEAPIFHKDLMMITEDRSDPSSIGIKNTYFIAEAYAIGGWGMLWFSVVIYAVNLLISYIFFVYILNKFIVNNLDFNKLIVAVFLFSFINITGGFSDLMFLKTTIMLFILLSPILALTFLYRILIKRRSNLHGIS